MNNFLDAYELMTSGNEVPKIFHRWSGLGCLSVLVGNRVWTPQGSLFTISPNVYIILTGPAGCRKTTALRQAQKIAQAVGGIPCAGASMTRQLMIMNLAKEDSGYQMSYKYQNKKITFSQLSIFASELINLLNAGGDPIGMIDFFTDVWDCTQSEYQDGTKNRGDFVAVRPYVSILGGITLRTARQLMSQKIISSGMTRRCIFVHGDDDGASVPFIEETADQKRAREFCIQFGRDLKGIAGPFEWTPESRATYTAWYHTNTERRRSNEPDILKEFLQTKPELVIKIAMLLALSNDKTKLVHSPAYIKEAIDLVTSIERGCVKLFAHAGENKDSAIADDICSYTKSRGGRVKQKELLEKFYENVDGPRLLKLLDDMKAMGKLKLEVVMENKRPVKYVVLIND